jgi:hypothetical protein
MPSAQSDADQISKVSIPAGIVRVADWQSALMDRRVLAPFNDRNHFAAR